ncbi:hypothetical protein AAVH_31925 [Aphelenchoides avenae]|nr:hypothetical protein AAVH_31925 [Aphelenchus avenae]
MGDNNERIMTLLPHHWTALINATRSGAIRRLGFNGVDFTALDDDAFLAAIGCRGLKTLEVRECVIRSGFVTDELVRSSVAKGFSELSLWGNKSDSPHRLSDDALMDFFLPLDVAAGRADLVLEGTGVTDMFFTKFIQRLRSGQVRPGSLQFFGAPEQRGLSERIRYLSRYLSGIGSTYRFPSTVDDNNSNKVHFFEDSPCIRLQF